MNTPSARVVIADASQQVVRANERGDTHVSMLTLDVVWLIEMAKRGIAHEADAEYLQQLQITIADLCKTLGANPDEVPCDVWHLAGMIETLRRDLITLARSWNRLGSNATAGWNEDDVQASEAASVRAGKVEMDET